ncbi:MAG: putative outer rane lipoprotein [Myxococcaceae bacterium]|jgi:hypothetical protein|nr:putative outer rane lipoprotein [Myxococcaceae bacterium]MEA2747957.1 hypothetical protein [Myxococcales bacterium]
MFHGGTLVAPALGMHSSMPVRALLSGFVVFLALSSAGCATSALSPQGAHVAATRNAPPADCVSLKYIVGKGGGTFGGKWIANDDLVEYAMNDLRNQAAKIGANYVQHDPPQLGNGDGTTTTATITGTAYRCNGPTTATTTAAAL